MIATKENEVNTLQKIRRMVADLGEDSYVGAAFDGCFDQAEENIRNDWCLSWKGKCESLQKDMTRLTAEADALRKENASLQRQMEKLSEQLQDNFTGQETAILLHVLETKKEDAMRDIEDAMDHMVLASDQQETDAFKDAATQAVDAAKRVKAYDAIGDKVRKRGQTV